MAVTSIDIKNRFPALYAQAKATKNFSVDAYIVTILTELVPLIDYEFWGVYSDLVTKLTVAHNLELELQKLKRGSNVGLEQSRSVVGQYSVSYATPTMGSIADAYETQYSIQIKILRDSLCPHFMVEPLSFGQREVNLFTY